MIDKRIFNDTFTIDIFTDLSIDLFQRLSKETQNFLTEKKEILSETNEPIGQAILALLLCSSMLLVENIINSTLKDNVSIREKNEIVREFSDALMAKIGSLYDINKIRDSSL